MQDAIRRLRPEFLTRRAYSLADDPYGGQPVVYLDGLRQGGLDVLQTMSAAAIAERFTPVV
ncbi:MAG TPA: hypothetical protein VKA84_28945 [Gemmatimonadaceae bacterium]|nr:hypothetical protein [Gemmatimonadaceae bacterium]